MLQASDLDDQTRNWLQLTYTTEQRELGGGGAASAEEAAANQPENEQQQQQQPQPPASPMEPAETPVASTSLVSSSSSSASSAAAAAAAAQAAAHSFGLPLDLSMPPATAHLGDLTSWDWSVFDVASSGATTDLLPVVYAVFQHFDFLRLYQIDVQVFRRWAAQVQKEYFDNPFHVSINDNTARSKRNVCAACMLTLFLC
jgi:hypothetical protein